MATSNLHIDNHYSDLLKKAKVIKLLAARGNDLRARFREHINQRVDNVYPPAKFDTREGAVPEMIKTHAFEALAKEPASLQKTAISSGKQSVGHDVITFDVNKTFQGERPSIIIGERQASKEFIVASETQATFSKVSGLQVRMGTEFEQ